MKPTAKLYRKWAAPRLLEFRADWALLRIKGRVVRCPARLEREMAEVERRERRKHWPFSLFWPA